MTAGNGSLVAFQFDTRADVDAFHATAVEPGGTCEGSPDAGDPGWWFSYFRDLDGNKLFAYRTLDTADD